ncbi:MAG: MFS transporter [Verrucomicrobiota bacterium]
MKELLRDFRIRRLLLANITGSVGSGITIFAVPWLLVHQPGGNETYGTVTLVTTVALFLFMPYYGVWVDRHSRKTMLLGSELFGFAATAAMAAVCAVAGSGLGTLSVIYFCGMLYYTLHFPAKFAFLQQVFDRSPYQSLMGLMEVQGQTAMMIAGGLGAVLVEHVSLTTILLLDAGTYLFSFAVQSTIPYHSTHLETGAPGPPTSAWRAIGEGWRWLRERPRLALFFAASLMPFIAVMVGNYLFPIYIAQTLGAGAWVFGAGEIVFAAGAILAGFSLPRLIATHSARRTVPLTMGLFAAGAALLVLFPGVILYLVAALLLGYGNAGSRVARSAALLQLVDNRVMGRVGAFFHAYDRVLRTVLTSAVIALVAAAGPRTAFALLLALVLLSLVVVLRSRSALAAAD